MPRRRAINVCSSCHQHKIRCDLDTSGGPCSHCREHRTECTRRTRKPYFATNRKKKRDDQIGSGHETPGTMAAVTSISPLDQSRVVSSVITNPSSRLTSIYVGESGYGSILDVLGPGKPKFRHVTVNGAADAALSAEDLEYLKLKGCFELPVESNELLAAYFHFVHPIFPVLNGSSFLRDHANGGLNQLNLLLVWSMFSVSASYVPACSAKGTKALFVMRGKALFDLGGENNKLILIQCALLLSFWFNDAEDIKESWYWSGIAFNIAQTMGLHYSPVPDSPLNMSKADCDTWMDTWHCCMIRDTWLSSSMGRPLRLDPSVRSTTLPSMSESRFQNMILYDANVYSEVEAEEFERMWRNSICVAQILRQSLTSTPSQPFVLSDYFTDRLQVQEAPASSLLQSLCARHLRLCQNAAMIAVCQPSGDKKGAAKAAAGDIIETVKLYQGDTTVAYVPPTIVPLIMPAMLVSIAAFKSTELYDKELGEERLSCCLQLLGEIERSYPSASIVKQLFHTASNTLRAQDHIKV